MDSEASGMVEESGRPRSGDMEIAMFWGGMIVGPLMAVAIAALFHDSLLKASYFIAAISGGAFLAVTIHARLRRRS